MVITVCRPRGLVDIKRLTVAGIPWRVVTNRQIFLFHNRNRLMLDLDENRALLLV